MIYERFEEWETRTKWAWNDQVDLLAHIEMHVVAPQPPQLEDSVVAHVIVVQAPNPNWATSLVSIFDVHPAPVRYAITTLDQIYVEHLLMVCNYDLACLYPMFPLQCSAWYDRINLQPSMPLPGRSGYSIVLQIRRVTTNEEKTWTDLKDEPKKPSIIINLETCLTDPPECMPSGIHKCRH